MPTRPEPRIRSRSAPRRRPSTDVWEFDPAHVWTTHQTGGMEKAASAPAGASDHVGGPDPRAALRARGLRATEARVLLLDAIRDLDHPTVDALHSATRDHGIALTTVYRTLETLERAGLVWAVHVPGTGRTYHPGTHAPHAHLLCRECGRLEDLEPIPEDALADRGVPDDFEVEHVQLTVIGRCSTCRTRG